jgi:aromatic-L-amino-acid/L-tryptophan decarboxylase
MENSDFRKYALEIVDWIISYYDNIEKFPVKSKLNPGDILKKIPTKAPQYSESMDEILDDFNKIIIPGITHWQSPSFHAYFPANNSYASQLGEMLISALGVQCMKWETSPAASELEEKIILWLQEALGLGKDFSGVLQDTASISTLSAMLTAREKYTNFGINKSGYSGNPRFRIYCSRESHSSIEKSAKIIGVGSDNVVKIDVDDKFSLQVDALEKEIIVDIARGFAPLCVVAAIGTTGSLAIDPLEKISEICLKYNIWLHVDAAYAGSALFLNEYRWMIKGIEGVDSFVFNPHKWLFTNFDCSAYFVRDKKLLVKTFAILPEYLKTDVDGQVNNYCDWGVPLGRRFRALKLWFVLRSFGVEGIQKKLKEHIQLTKIFVDKISSVEGIRIMAPVNLNLVCFQYAPSFLKTTQQRNVFNKKLMDDINSEGFIYLTHTKLASNFVLRVVIGQTNVTLKHVKKAVEVICKHIGVNKKNF